jgi:hypothetical protein
MNDESFTVNCACCYVSIVKWGCIATSTHDGNYYVHTLSPWTQCIITINASLPITRRITSGVRSIKWVTPPWTATYWHHKLVSYDRTTGCFRLLRIFTWVSYLLVVEFQCQWLILVFRRGVLIQIWAQNSVIVTQQSIMFWISLELRSW